MRRFLLWVGLSSVNFLFAQPKCGSFEYQKQLIQALPSLEVPRKAIENFVFDRESLRSFSPSRLEEENVITIPVVVHLLYHYPGENISDDVVHSQIFALNRDYRKLNSDTIKIPGAFKPLAADCEIEFKLATVDASGRATTGIVRKYTPVTKWTADDKIKSSSEAGDDPWDAASYLNIWVGTMDRVLGYSSTPGDPASKDGVVISNTVFGITNSGIYDQGRTAVHEVGHWLGLRHLWGDTNCGDDGVADTPPQQTFTNGCPSTVRISCNNGPNGDMYMDYMDFTNDDCLVMFTHGQKQKMRTLFEIGGPRHSILLSKGLDVPAIAELPLPDNPPQWLQIKIFPNPATTQLTINMEYDERWVGKQLQVIDMTGKVQIVKTITSKVQKLDVSQLAPGVYFLKSEKTGEKMMQKFIKL
jgi:type IX secretion system substrate protein/pregnancy-associated plasma protein-A